MYSYLFNYIYYVLLCILLHIVITFFVIVIGRCLHLEFRYFNIKYYPNQSNLYNRYKLLVFLY